jgi:hypothetical protein
MGTRALTYVYDRDDRIVCIYSQWDGYPSGHGRDLAVFLNGIQLINGITGKETVPVANGMGCLAAQLVVHLKKEVGNYYLVKGGDHGQEYEYHIHEDRIVVFTTYEYHKIIFEGTWAEFSDFCRVAN